MRTTIALLVFGAWVAWASFSTGGLHKLKQMNPKFPHPDKSVPYLQGKLEYDTGNGMWDTYHVGQCSFYMPNWKQAERCVRARILCEAVAPRENGVINDRADIFSARFEQCVHKSQPWRTPGWWLRASRSLWRAGSALALVSVTGGAETTGSEALRWEEDNGWWARPVMSWVDEGE